MEGSKEVKDRVGVYNGIALVILDDQGQVEVAELVAAGNLSRAQLLLVAHADYLYEDERLSRIERDELHRQLGLTAREVVEIQNTHQYIGIRGILSQNEG